MRSGNDEVLWLHAGVQSKVGSTSCKVFFCQTFLASRFLSHACDFARIPSFLMLPCITPLGYSSHTF